jgi:bifunctional non-homologous end joining protein LigD
VSPERVETEVDGRTLSLSNLDKVLYPQTGFTKAQVLDYYSRIAAVMVPHLADRPATFRRYPNGVEASSFFEKNVPSHAPDWVRSVRVASTKRDGSDDSVTHPVVEDRATLVWAANLAALELHVPLWHVGRRRNLPAPPDYLVFDLDPGPDTTIVECARVGLWIKQRLAAEEGGEAFAKTSGSKGLQLYVRLRDTKDWSSRDRALELAQAIETDHPELVVTNMRKDLRRGKILIDWSQNHPAKTTVAVYSLRARPEPTASTPVTWDEVSDCERSGDPARLRFEAADVLKRVDRHGDLFASLLSP